MLSPHIDFSQLEQSHWSTRERANAQQVIEFVQLLMNEHNFDEVRQRYGNQAYRQHNRIIKDGIEGVITTVSKLVKQNPEYSYDVKRLMVDGDLVTIHSHATLSAKHRGNESQGFNIMDTWRLKEGQLTEHWDTIQGLNFAMRLYSLIAGGAVRNNNGVF